MKVIHTFFLLYGILFFLIESESQLCSALLLFGGVIFNFSEEYKILFFLFAKIPMGGKVWIFLQGKRSYVMLEKIWKFKVQFLVLLLSIVVTWYCASLIKNYPETGISVKCNSGQYIICDVSKYSWAGKRDFEIGDIIEKIDGESPSKHFTVLAYHSVEQVKKITLNRNGEIKEFEIEYPPYSKQLFYHFMIPIGFYVVCFLMALYLLMFVPKLDRSTNDLVYFFVSLGVSFISIMAVQRKDTLSFIVASTSLVCVFTFFIRFMKLYFANNQIKFLTSKQLQRLNVMSIFLILLSIFVYTKYNEWANLFTIAVSML
ncbi:TPA: hypothetical protein ACTZ5N_005122, partial [Bacillus cereus]